MFKAWAVQTRSTTKKSGSQIEAVLTNQSDIRFSILDIGMTLANSFVRSQCEIDLKIHANPGSVYSHAGRGGRFGERGSVQRSDSRQGSSHSNPTHGNADCSGNFGNDSDDHVVHYANDDNNYNLINDCPDDQCAGSGRRRSRAICWSDGAPGTDGYVHVNGWKCRQWKLSTFCWSHGSVESNCDIRYNHV